MLKHAPGVGLVQRGAIHHDMAQNQPAIAGEIDIDHLDVGIDETDIILPRQFAPNAPIAALVVDRIDLHLGFFLRIVVEVEHAQLSHQAGTRN